MKTLISRKELAERWDFDSPQSIMKYENEGILKRNPNFSVPRYYMEEVLKVESLKEVNPLSPLERRRLERQVEKLEEENRLLKDKILNVQMVIGQVI